MLSGFKTFVMRGNVVDLAVAVVIGTAFARVVDALVQGLINPLIAALFGQADLSEVWAVQLGPDPEPTLRIGLLLDAALQFLLVAAAIYFLVVLPLNTLAARRASGVEPAPTAPAQDILLLTEIRDLLATRREP